MELKNLLKDREMSVSREDVLARFEQEQKRENMALGKFLCTENSLWHSTRTAFFENPSPCPHCKGNYRYSCSTHYLCKSCNHCWKKSNTISYYSSSDTSYPAWSELDRTSSLDLFPQAYRSTDQWMKVGETALGTSPSAGYANSNRLNNSPAEYSSSATSSQAWFALDGGAITNRAVCVDMVHGDGTATLDPLSLARRKMDQWMKVGETVLGTSASAGYASSSSQAKFPFAGNASVCINVGSNLNDIHGDGTATMDPILQERLSTDQWVKLAEIVLTISATVVYSSSTHFPKAANAAGFIASLTAISLRSKWKTATRVLAKFGAIACAAGTLAAIGNDLPEEYKWIGTVAFLIPAVTVLFA